MSINDIPFNTAGASDEITQNIVMSNPNDLHYGPTSRNVPNSPQTGSDRSVNPTIATPHTTVATQSAIGAQPAPRRVWEAGYESPFTRRFNHPFDPLHDDTQSGHYSYNTDSPSNTLQGPQNDYPPFPTVNTPIQLVPTPSSSVPHSPLATDTITLQHSESVPPRTTSNSYRPRIRKVVTREITLDELDISAMVTLGLSPFMVGQDMIANQNRFVRNECVFARQFLRLQRAVADADARHSQTERDIYKHLERHKALSDGPIEASSSTGTHALSANPDFLALEKAHQETCARLEALSQQVVEYSQSTQRALMDLAQHIGQITRTGDYPSNPDANSGSHATTAPHSESPLLLSTTSNLKRKWDSSSESTLESPNTMPPPTPDFRNHHCQERSRRQHLLPSSSSGVFLPCD